MSYAKRGIAVRLAYLAGACCWWALTLGGRLGRGRVVVLCYHGVRDEQAARFRRQARRIAKRAVGSWDIEAAESMLGRQRVCLTFDDAFANLLTNALPALKELNAPATVFAVSENLGATPRWAMPEGHPEAGEVTMTAEQVASCSGDLVRIGSHTRTHPMLTRLDDNALREELAGSREALERIVGSPVTELAFPHGDYDDRVVRAAHGAGYGHVYTLDPIAHPGRLPGGVVGRCSADPDMWGLEFFLTCDGAYGWLDGLRRLVRRMKSRGEAPTAPAREAAA
ncbi:MAG: polysaccharide deacetylase family protein [Phycisphaerales bacterium]